MITRNYNDMAFTFREDGYFNMTKAAKHFGKDVYEFMRLPSTKEYQEALAGIFPCKELVLIQRGNGLLPSVGTWGHPKLAVRFAQWLDVRFAVWCDSMIEDILKGNSPPSSPPPPPPNP